MKNYNEMTNDVFRRRDEYLVRQQYRRKMIVRGVSSAGVLCLGAMITAFGIWNNGRSFSAATDGTSAVKAVETAEGGTAKGNEADNVIVINRIDEITASRQKLNISLLQEDYIAMSREELINYYGADVFPTVPSDMNEKIGEDGYGIYAGNGGSGDIYWDQSVINYSGSDMSRSINMEVRKGKMPLSDYGKLSEECEPSIICGAKVYAALTEEGYYFVEFMYNNIGFRIVTEGLSEYEMLSVIASIIK